MFKNKEFTSYRDVKIIKKVFIPVLLAVLISQISFLTAIVAKDDYSYSPQNFQEQNFAESRRMEKEPMPSEDRENIPFQEQFYREKFKRRGFEKEFPQQEWPKKENRIIPSAPEESIFKPSSGEEIDSMMQNFMPPACRERSISDPQKCEELIKKRFEEENKKSVNFPPTEDSFEQDRYFDSKPSADKKNGLFDFLKNGEKNEIDFIPQDFIHQEKARLPVEFLSGRGLKNEQDLLPPSCQKENIENKEDCFNFLQESENVPLKCRGPGIADEEECEKIMHRENLPIECMKAGFTDFEDCKRVIGQQFLPPECKEAGLTDTRQCEEFLTKKYMPKECQDVGITNEKDCEIIMIEKLMPKKCKDVGTASKEECEKIIIAEQNKIDDIDFKADFPSECADAGIVDKLECKKFLIKGSFPKPCEDNGIYRWKECRVFMNRKFMPPECQERGATSEEKCDQIMREKYMPPECVEARTATSEECDKVMERKYLPRDCKDNGLTVRKECDEYLMLKFMPRECREQGAKTPQECDKIMRQLHLAPECGAVGIVDDRECEEYMFNKYRPPEIACEGMTKAECEQEIKERYLGLLVEDRKEKIKIKEKLLPHIGKKLSFKKSKLEKIKEIEGGKQPTAEEEAGLAEIIPLDIAQDVSIDIIPSDEKSLLKEKNRTIVQSVPVLIVVDSDNDGLPDDMEKNIGSDPYSADTDNDGYLDGEEVKNNLNPLGSGELIKDVAPIEKAILNQEILEQPIIDGDVKEDLMRINEVATIFEDGEGTEKALKISGKAIPNSTVTLYIYSAIAILANTRVDVNGNWSYDFKQKLKDGDHDIYAAITDENGKIGAKSNPKSFFVKDAQAKEVKEVITQKFETSEQKQKTKTQKTSIKKLFPLAVWYEIAAIILVVAGLFVMAFVLKKIKKGPGK